MQRPGSSSLRAARTGRHARLTRHGVDSRSPTVARAPPSPPVSYASTHRSTAYAGSPAPADTRAVPPGRTSRSTRVRRSADVLRVTLSKSPDRLGLGVAWAVSVTNAGRQPWTIWSLLSTRSGPPRSPARVDRSPGAKGRAPGGLAAARPRRARQPRHHQPPRPPGPANTPCPQDQVPRTVGLESAGSAASGACADRAVDTASGWGHASAGRARAARTRGPLRRLGDRHVAGVSVAEGTRPAEGGDLGVAGSRAR